jgi:hypothetical protein
MMRGSLSPGSMRHNMHGHGHLPPDIRQVTSQFNGSAMSSPPTGTSECAASLSLHASTVKDARSRRVRLSPRPVHPMRAFPGVFLALSALPAALAQSGVSVAFCLYTYAWVRPQLSQVARCADDALQANNAVGENPCQVAAELVASSACFNDCTFAVVLFSLSSRTS